jgi:hypothetical protein
MTLLAGRQFVFEISYICSEEAACIQVGIPGDVTYEVL